MSYLSLKIFKQGRLIKTKIFTDDQISIGSSEGLSLQLEGLSPWHILIERKHDIFCILDLNSEEGTKLNGQEITEETPISSGSTIKAGPYEFQFFIGPPTDKSAKAGPSTPSEKRAKLVPSPPVEDTVPVPESSSFDSQPQPESPKMPPKKPAAPEAVSVAPKPPLQQELVVKRPIKPLKKGFWNTYAPVSKIQNLDDFLEPSIGNLIEVIVCWKERILSNQHFFRNGDVFMGSGKDCQVKFPNMLGQASYKLLGISAGAKIHLSHGVKGTLFQGKDKSTRTSHNLTGAPYVILKPYEMVKLDFGSSLNLYVRLMDKPAKIPFVGLLNLRLSEAMALFLAFLLTGILLFYGSLYAPAFLAGDVNFIEKDIRVAKVIFKRPPKAPVVEYKLRDQTRKASLKPRRPRAEKKKSSVKSTKRIKRPRRVRPRSNPRTGKTGKIAGQAPGKKQPKKLKVSVGSVRPGGSLKTGKKGSSVKTVAPDPTKVGLLGVFGGSGRLTQLDKGATGSGGILGLADKATGFAGTRESYEGEGIGTKTKDLGTGGRGSALVGISGVKTKGKGLGRAGTGTGGLGKRGRMNIEFGTEDIDVSGEIDRAAILQVLRKNQSKFQRCYQMSLNERPSIQGHLGMQWLISSNGRGRAARAIKDQLGSRSLANCVASVLERINFPEPPSGQTPKVTFTFRFYL